MASFWSEMAGNRTRTWLLFAFFFALLFAVAYFFGWYTGMGSFGIAFAAIVAVLLTVGGYYYSDKIVLATTGARPANKQEHQYLVNVVEGLSLAAGIPQPRIYVIDDDSINAFATGRDPQHAVVCVTTGALKKLNREQLEGVVAHEISHVKNEDIKVMMLAAVFAGCIIILSDMLIRVRLFGGGGNDRGGRGGAIFMVVGFLLVILAPIFAQVIRLAVSRSREYLADASGAQLTRYPEGLASALDRISKDAAPMRNASNATAHLFISNPFKAKMMGSLFSTHPPLDDRIKRLRAM
ncbi:MAG: M48 family metallopeptidase [Candidatus Micrarchaeota archaeon]